MRTARTALLGIALFSALVGAASVQGAAPPPALPPGVYQGEPDATQAPAGRYELVDTEFERAP